MFQWIFRFSDFTCFLDSWLPTNLKPWRGTQTWALRALPVFSSCTPTKKVNPQAPVISPLCRHWSLCRWILANKCFEVDELKWIGMGWPTIMAQEAEKRKRHTGTLDPATVFSSKKYRGKMIWTKTHGMLFLILDGVFVSACFILFPRLLQKNHPNTSCTLPERPHVFGFWPYRNLRNMYCHPLECVAHDSIATFLGWRVVMLLQFAQVKFVKGTFAQNLRPCVPYGMNHDTRESCLNWTAGLDTAGTMRRRKGICSSFMMAKMHSDLRRM